MGKSVRSCTHLVFVYTQTAVLSQSSHAWTILNFNQLHVKSLVCLISVDSSANAEVEL